MTIFNGNALAKPSALESSADPANSLEAENADNNEVPEGWVLVQKNEDDGNKNVS